MLNKIWYPVCYKRDLVNNSGICVLLKESTQIAVFLIEQTEQKLFAIDNFDPIAKANVLYRGIVGSHQGQPVVASPMFKQRFSLLSGQCLDTDSQVVTTYPSRYQDDMVELQLTPGI